MWNYVAELIVAWKKNYKIGRAKFQVRFVPPRWVFGVVQHILVKQKVYFLDAVAERDPVIFSVLCSLDWLLLA